ncbi:MAG: ATP-dependent DNA helicase RecG, partial [Candidatus Sericytochromatia bacterium]
MSARKPETKGAKASPADQEHWLHLFERSLKVEEKQNCRNVKGQQYYFADFMLYHLDQGHFDARHARLISRLKNIYTLYPLAAVAERRQLLSESWRHLETLRGSVKKPREADVRLREQLRKAPPVADWRDVPVQFVKGVGPKLGETFAKVGVATVGQLLNYFPRKHLDYSCCTRIRELEAGQSATIWGTITQVSSFTPPGKQGLFILKLTVRDGSGRLNVSFFHRGSAYVRKMFESRFPIGAQILMSGTAKWDRFEKGLTLDSPACEVIADAESAEDSLTEASLHLGRIVPIYPLTEGLNVKWVRKAIHNALSAYAGRIQDPLPPELRQRLGLTDLGTAYQQYHFPQSEELLEAARQRLVFQELFLTQLGLQFRRRQRELHEPGLSLASNGKLAQAFLSQLPFTLTGAQQRVVREILADLRRPEPMSRLVQGDVGSGKTVVAVLALLEAIEAGYQGALMAPTEILAEQHFQKIFAWFLALGLQTELLTGSKGGRERRQARERLASGEAALAIGTHALIQEGVSFAKLGLIIIDEQHRFGVKQRALLREKGQHPEVLTMTATPIPRTLALTAYGDLDVSQVDELPPGRKPVETRLVRGVGQREQLWEFMRRELAAGRQCYVVFPLVEESEKIDLKAATVEFEVFRDEIFPEFRVGLLHGKMKSADKELIMRAFVAHELDILVATTVIEVGVDVPNASMMVIEHAERFGLAQLHQLRGRVGRGSDRAYCFLAADKLSELSRERLDIFTRTHNGFVIAEQDLRLRGPGEFLGTRQSGMPDLVLTNLAEDTEWLEAARTEAAALIETDPELVQARHL